MEVTDYLKDKVLGVLKPSRLGGVGFFAVRDIEVGEVIFEPWLGPSGIYSITLDELGSLPKLLSKNIYETFHNKLYYLDREGNEKVIPKEYGKLFFPLEKGYHWVYIWPKMFLNSGLSQGNVNSNEHTLPVVTKPILKGEEILGNYGSQFKSTPKNFL